MARFLVIAGGRWQVPLVKMLKQDGHFVVCSNLHEQSDCFPYADAGVVADVLDIKKNIEIATRFSVDAVVTDQSDIAVLTVATVADKLGLKGIGIDVANIFSNKYLMRQQIKKYYGDLIQFDIATSKKEAIKAVTKVGFPCIMKPVDSQSSRGVFKLNCMLDLEQFFAQSIQHSYSRTIIIETYLEGLEITVDGFKPEKLGHQSLAISKKEHYKHNNMVARSLLFQQNFLEFDNHKLEKFHNNLIDELGLPFGLTHAEYIVFDNNFYLIEVAARGGGSFVSSMIVPIMSGFDSTRQLTQLLISKEFEKNKTTLNQKRLPNFCKLEFIELQAGKVLKSQPDLSCISNENILHVNLDVVYNKPIQAPSDDRSRHGFFIAQGQTMEEIETALSEAKNNLEFCYA